VLVTARKRKGFAQVRERETIREKARCGHA
jgi:hypothetical protein